MPHLPLARRACLLVLIVLLLSACRGPVAPKPPDPTIPPVLISPPATEVPAISTPTLLPSPTPLPQLDRPIIWYLRGATPVDLSQVNEQLNQALAEKGFNARVELRVIEESAFDQRMADVLSPGAYWDLVSLSGASYPAWVENGNLLPLSAYPNPASGQVENLLEQQSPRLWFGIPLAIWAGVGLAARDGQIYAFPNPSTWAAAPGVTIRADVVRALKLQVDLDRARAFADLTPLLAKIQAAIEAGTLKAGGVANGDKIRRAVGPANLLLPEIAGYDPLWGPFAVRFDDPQRKVINWYESVEFKDLVNLRRGWQQAGYFPADPLSPDQVIEACRAGQYVVAIGRPVWSGSALEQARRCGYDWIDRPLAPSFLRTEAVLSSVTGVNARLADDPERVHRVMQFLNLLRGDPDIMNLPAGRITGQQWTDGEKQENMTGPLSVALGFTFDPRPVAAETAAVRGLTPELIDPLANGQAKNVDQSIGALSKTLDEAGLATIQAELDRQWKIWLDAQK